jgi:hypothetical protein
MTTEPPPGDHSVEAAAPEGPEVSDEATPMGASSQDEATPTDSYAHDGTGHLKMFQLRTRRVARESVLLLAGLLTVIVTAQLMVGILSGTSAPIPTTEGSGSGGGVATTLTPSPTTFPTTTVAVNEPAGSTSTQDPNCKVATFYPEASKRLTALGIVHKYLFDDGTKPTATCRNGWAILQGFGVEAGSGWGIAIFKKSVGVWNFVMFGDNSQAGPGYVYCNQYPAEARVALGKALCP